MSHDKPIYQYLRAEKKFPLIWCPGCGDGIVLKAMLRAIEQHGVRPVVDRVYAFDELKEALARDSDSAELDFYREGTHAERFCEDFAHNPIIEVPKVFWDHTTDRVLTLERIGIDSPETYATAVRTADAMAAELGPFDRAEVLDGFSRRRPRA